MSDMKQVYRFAESHIDEILEEAEGGDYSGFCTACGEMACSGIEPDACGYQCEACGEMAVYGAEELMLYAYA